MKHQQRKTIRPQPAAVQLAIYQCTYSGCDYTNTTGDRHQHGRAQVETRRRIDIGAMYADLKPVKNGTAGSYQE